LKREKVGKKSAWGQLVGVEDMSMAKWQHNCTRTEIAGIMVYF